MRPEPWSALVTGGASGLGLAVVERLLDRGADVVVADLPRSPGDEVARQHDGVRFVPGDVRDPADVERAVRAAAELAPLRVAVAAAGVVPPTRLFDRDQDGLHERARLTFDVNLLGTYHVIAHAGLAMSENEDVDGDRGVIVCTASVAAYDGQIGQVAYSASKAGVAGMTLPAARELARHHVRVVSVAPGIFDTPMLAGLPERARQAAASQVPHPARLGSPREFADLVEHIVDNRMLNGEVIRLDGALRMSPR
jgi:NAD(P)-dependent dehydrogenase (short-subunit alcohol dehydrogenase family)